MDKTNLNFLIFSALLGTVTSMFFFSQINFAGAKSKLASVRVENNISSSANTGSVGAGSDPVETGDASSSAVVKFHGGEGTNEIDVDIKSEANGEKTEYQANRESEGEEFEMEKSAESEDGSAKAQIKVSVDGDREQNNNEKFKDTGEETTTTGENNPEGTISAFFSTIAGLIGKITSIFKG